MQVKIIIFIAIIIISFSNRVLIHVIKNLMRYTLHAYEFIVYSLNSYRYISKYFKYLIFIYVY
jgi:hypothetical protein